MISTGYEGQHVINKSELINTSLTMLDIFFSRNITPMIATPGKHTTDEEYYISNTLSLELLSFHAGNALYTNLHVLMCNLHYVRCSSISKSLVVD